MTLGALHTNRHYTGPCSLLNSGDDGFRPRGECEQLCQFYRRIVSPKSPRWTSFSLLLRSISFERRGPKSRTGAPFLT
jgi:hypothetical protein